MQAATARIGNMRFDGSDGELLHEVLRSLSAGLQTEADHAAAAVRQVLEGAFVFGVGGKSRIAYPTDGRMFLQELCERKSIGTVLCHSQVQALQTEIKKEGALGRLGAAEIAHELRCGFGDECAGQAEALGIDEAMVAFIRSGQTGKFSACAVQSKLPESTMQPPTAQP